MRAGSLLLGALWIAVSTACATAPPENVEDICSIFEEKRGWYKAAMKSEKRWGTPTHVQMSIIRHELKPIVQCPPGPVLYDWL